jgi:hypothetical protein
MLRKPSIQFHALAEAALHNWDLLCKKENSLQMLLLEQPVLVISPGSEFWQIKQFSHKPTVGLLEGRPYPWHNLPA